jgi:hypothetical protein
MIATAQQADFFRNSALTVQNKEKKAEGYYVEQFFGVVYFKLHWAELLLQRLDGAGGNRRCSYTYNNDIF